MGEVRLGNSGGKNRGVKYLNHSNLPNKEFTKEDKIRIEKYNEWFSKNQDRIHNMVATKWKFDEDIMQLTYARVYNNVAYAGLSILDYSSYFCKAYYTNYILNRKRESMLVSYYVNREFFSLGDIELNTLETFRIEVIGLIQCHILMKIHEVIKTSDDLIASKDIILRYLELRLENTKNYLKTLTKEFNVSYSNINNLIIKVKRFLVNNLTEEYDILVKVRNSGTIECIDDIVYSKYAVGSMILNEYEELKDSLNIL